MMDVFAVAELEFNLTNFDWPFVRERAGEITQNWARRCAALPQLFDGRVLLTHRHAYERRADGTLRLSGEFFETAYSNFLSWRDFGSPGGGVHNVFSMAALQSADGAFLLGEMGAHTANAGQIYFAAGTPDLQDVFGDRVDLLASVKRELEEETGVSPSETEIDPAWIVVDSPPGTACMKILRSPLTATALQVRIHEFLARDQQPELARMHVVRTQTDLDGLRVSHFVGKFLAHMWERP